MLALAEYQDLIHLNDPFPLPVDDTRKWHDVLMTALTGLPNKHYTGTSSVLHLATDEALLRWLQAELTQLDPGPLDPITERAINSALLRVSGAHGRVEGAHLRRVAEIFPRCDYPQATHTALYLGDIRQLVVDAVVNSALPNLTGCRIPLHGCLDSEIHLQAGPWLRNDCAAIMELLAQKAAASNPAVLAAGVTARVDMGVESQCPLGVTAEQGVTAASSVPQKHDLPELPGGGATLNSEHEPPSGIVARTGTAYITRGYRMPARYLIHTVPPELNGAEPMQRQREFLRDCYWNSLELARAKGDVRTIAFPALSTGMNGFPFEEAARIALRTVDDWLRVHEAALDLVLFSVHNDEDLATMERVLTSWI